MNSRCTFVDHDDESGGDISSGGGGGTFGGVGDTATERVAQPVKLITSASSVSTDASGLGRIDLGCLPRIGCELLLLRAGLLFGKGQLLCGNSSFLGKRVGRGVKPPCLHAQGDD